MGNKCFVEFYMLLFMIVIYSVAVLWTGVILPFHSSQYFDLSSRVNIAFHHQYIRLFNNLPFISN